ncbi:MAG: hypothetical protein ACE5E3_06175 [Mariprofundus sp.]
MSNTHKLITCVVPEANASEGAEALRQQYGLQTITHHFARGTGKSAPLIKRGVGEQTEKVVLSVIVETGVADEVFEFLYHAVDINRPRGGLMFMNAIHAAKFNAPLQVKQDNAQ